MEPVDLRDIYARLICTKHEFGAIAIRKLECVMNEPTTDNWDSIHQAVLRRDSYLDVWGAVLHVDPTFDSIGRIVDEDKRIWRDWSRVPDRETLIRALVYAAYRDE